MPNVRRSNEGRVNVARHDASELQPCVDSETEALTARGWLPYGEIRPGDRIRSLNLSTGMSEWNPVERVHVFAGQRHVRRLDARSHSSVTALGHTWVTRDHYTERLRTRRTADLRTNDRIIRAAPPADLPTVPVYSDALVELLGWFWTEGHIRADGAIQIYQSWRVNRPHCLRIRAAMLEVFGEPSVTLNTGRWRIPGWVEREPTERKGVIEWYLNAPLARTITDLAPNRTVLPSVVAAMTIQQLRRFVETSVDADGHRRDYRSDSVLAQKDLRQIEAAEMAWALLGVPTTRTRVFNHVHGRRWWAIRPGTQAEIRPVASARRNDSTFAQDVVETADGVGWCPEVANGTWLARRRGTVYYTGAFTGFGQLTLPLMWAGMAA